MRRPRVLGPATAAAALPSAFAAAILVSAPFAGTSTGPLTGTADAPRHAHAHTPASADAAVFPETEDTTRSDLVSAEIALLVGGAASLAWVTRRPHAAR